MDTEEVSRLKEVCREVRYLTMDAIGRVGVGHVGGSLSVVEALVVLYHRHMRIDPADPRKEGRDRFVLSKGHAGPALYAVLTSRGYFDKSLLETLNQLDTRLPSHCDMNRTPGVIHVLTNKGTIGCLGMSGVYAKAEGESARGSVVSGPGVIQQQDRQNVFTVNVHPDLAK